MSLGKWCSRHKKFDCKCGRRGYAEIDKAIIRAMQRVYLEKDETRVFPETLLPYMESPYFCSKRTLREHMSRLAEEGKLIRFPKSSGYELPQRERWCHKHKKFQCACGRNGLKGIEEAIIAAMRQALVEDGRVSMFPHEVLIYIEDRFFCDHGTIRGYMAKLARMGKLIRLGSRQGYKLAASS